MNKPYELSGLVEELKVSGLPGLEVAAEAEAKAVYVAVKAWLTKSAAMTATPFDDMAVGLVAQLDGAINAAIEKIDIDGDGK